MPISARPDRLRRVSFASTSFGYGIKHAAVCVAMAVATGGCALSLPRWNPDGWLGDFDTAEQRVAESEKELLILYVSGRWGRESNLQQALDSDLLATVVKDKVRCVLSRSYEPDRRYVAQYGVDRAPAVVLVHRDGTYHARTGPMTPGDVKAFLASAKPPGAVAVYNPQVPRRARYQWQDAIEPALAQATREGKPTLVVYHRTMSRDWRRLKKMLHRHEVCLRLGDLVHCRIALPGFSRDTAITPFGALRLPAMVIVRPDGQHAVLELPTSHESVVHFAESALSPDAQRAANPTLLGAPVTTP